LTVRSAAFRRGRRARTRRSSNIRGDPAMVVVIPVILDAASAEATRCYHFAAERPGAGAALTSRRLHACTSPVDDRSPGPRRAHALWSPRAESNR
jgi:hypothetical protein